MNTKSVNFLVILGVIIYAMMPCYFLPSLHSIAGYFSLDRYEAQLLLPTFVFGICISSFFSGILSDYFDIVSLVKVHIMLAMLGLLLDAFSLNVFMLIVGFFIQGLGFNFHLLQKMGYHTIQEEGHSYHLRLKALTWGSFFLIIAPIIFGFVQASFGWRYVFCLMFLINFLYYGLFFIIPVNFYCKSLDFSLPFVGSNALRVLGILIKQKSLFVHASMTAVQLVIMTFFPYIFMVDYQYSDRQFSIILMFTLSGMFFGALMKLFFNKRNSASFEHSISRSIVVSVVWTLLYIGINYFIKSSYILIIYSTILMFIFGYVVVDIYELVFSSFGLYAGLTLGCYALMIYVVKFLSTFISSKNDAEVMGVMILILYLVALFADEFLEEKALP